MCFFDSLGRSRNCPTLRPLSPCKTPQFTGANFLPLTCSRFFPPLPAMAASLMLPFTFIIHFWLLFPSCPGFSEGVMLWLWTSSPPTVSLTPPRLVLRS